MQQSRSEVRDQQILWRRTKVLNLASKGLNDREIASSLQISYSTISRDIIILKREAKANISKYIDEQLPLEYHKCLMGITEIMKEAWKTAAKAEEEGETRDKLAALELAQSCYSMKLDLLSSATVIDRAVKFVEYHKVKPLPLIDQNDELAIDSNNNNASESQ